MILLDTDVLIWLDQDNPRLGPSCRIAIDEGLAKNDLQCPISFWEVAMLHRHPADRFIAATAVVSEATLATADQRILTWQANVERLDATR